MYLLVDKNNVTSDLQQPKPVCPLGAITQNFS